MNAITEKIDFKSGQWRKECLGVQVKIGNILPFTAIYMTERTHDFKDDHIENNAKNYRSFTKETMSVPTAIYHIYANWWELSNRGWDEEMIFFSF